MFVHLMQSAQTCAPRSECELVLYVWFRYCNNDHASLKAALAADASMLGFEEP